MSKRFSVKRWHRDVLQAASMQSGVCEHEVPMVGIDMCGQDGKTFAHGHFDLETARAFHQQLGETIELAAEKLRSAH